MGQVTIYLSLVSGTTQLHLKDSEGHEGDGSITTLVDPGDTVVWEIVSGSGITAINDIYKKEGSLSLFSTGPSADANGTWSGVISANAKGEESYSIKYTVGGNQYVDDPQLKVRT